MSATALRTRPGLVVPPAGYRRDVQGLRAVAAVLVATYHVFTDRVSGGVDVFFVVAGMLTTATLLHHIDAYGRPRAGLYLSRLMSRLLPQALLVLAVVGTAVAVLAPQAWRAAWFDQIAASAAYGQNWALVSQSVDYLAGGEPDSPVQHFWALSLQGQFYLLWLLLFVVATALLPGRRGALAGLLAALLLGSLAWSVVLTAVDQPVAYFHTGTRAWEFAAGGMLGMLFSRTGRIGGRSDGRAPALARACGSRLSRGLMSWLGLAMIVSGGLLFSVASSFPGWAALWPVTGASLVLLGGRGPAAPWSATRLLGTPALVWLGGISYGIYLWHWPLLAFYRQQTMREDLDLFTGLAVVVSAVGLAVFSTYLVEAPFRVRARRWSRPGVMIAACTSTALLVAGGGVTTSERVDEAIASDELESFDADVFPGAAAGVPQELPSASPRASELPLFVPSLAVAKKAKPSPRVDGCQEGLLAREPKLCHYGDTDGDLRLVMVGGSHTTHLFTPLESIAIEHGWRLDYMARGGCRLSTSDFGGSDMANTCEEWNRRAIQILMADPPDVVIALGTVSGNATDDGGTDHETLPDGFLDAWQRLARAGIHVIAVRDTPRWKTDPINCLSVHEEDPAACSLDRAETLAAVSPLDETRLPATVAAVDLTTHLCNSSRCPAVVGGVVAYFDRGHLSEALARTLVEPLDHGLIAAFEQWGLA